jgi:Putative transmembrane protein 170
VVMLKRSWKFVWVVPILYAVLAGVEAFLAGSMVGGLLGALYNSAFARMSTWIPFVWGLIITLALVLGAFAIQGGM